MPAKLTQLLEVKSQFSESAEKMGLSQATIDSLNVVFQGRPTVEIAVRKNDIEQLLALVKAELTSLNKAESARRITAPSELKFGVDLSKPDEEDLSAPGYKLYEYLLADMENPSNKKDLFSKYTTQDLMLNHRVLDYSGIGYYAVLNYYIKTGNVRGADLFLNKTVAELRNDLENFKSDSGGSLQSIHRRLQETKEYYGYFGELINSPEFKAKERDLDREERQTATAAKA